MNDVIQYEHDYVITTKTRHRTPMVRTTSIANMEEGERRSHLSQVKGNPLSCYIPHNYSDKNWKSAGLS